MDHVLELSQSMLIFPSLGPEHFPIFSLNSFIVFFCMYSILFIVLYFVWYYVMC